MKTAVPTLPRGGVYVITNNVDDRVYIGSSATVRRRWISHRADLKAGRHSFALQSFWNEHKHRIVLYFAILESFVGQDKDHRMMREQYWLDYYRAYDPAFGFNTNFLATSGESVVRRPDTVAKMANASSSWKRTPEYCEAIRQRRLGKRHPPETIAKISAAKKDKRSLARHLTYEQAEEIRGLCRSGVRQDRLALRFGVSIHVVSGIATGRTYRVA